MVKGDGLIKKFLLDICISGLYFLNPDVCMLKKMLFILINVIYFLKWKKIEAITCVFSMGYNLKHNFFLRICVYNFVSTCFYKICVY